MFFPSYSTFQVPKTCNEYIGDGYCDDENNNAECNFDEGDCCNIGGYVNWDDFCTICKCKADVTTTSTIVTSTETTSTVDVGPTSDGLISTSSKVTSTSTIAISTLTTSGTSTPIMTSIPKPTCGEILS